MICKRLIILAIIAMSACSSAETERLEKITSELAEIESRDAACFAAQRAQSEAQGASSLREWDTAAAENLENVSPEQEWEIRKQLAREMNLAPSEVDGWKDIYRSRAKQAKANGQRNRASLEVGFKLMEEACASGISDGPKKRALELEQTKLRGY